MRVVFRQAWSESQWTVWDILLSQQMLDAIKHITDDIFGSRPSDHYFRSVCWFVCLFVQLFFSAAYPISLKIGHVLYVWV